MKLTKDQKAMRAELRKARKSLLKSLNIRLTKKDDVDGLDGCHTCRKSASCAAAALKAYVLKAGSCEAEEAVVDLLSDLMHLCDILGVDLDYDTWKEAEGRHAEEAAFEDPVDAKKEAEGLYEGSLAVDKLEWDEAHKLNADGKVVEAIDRVLDAIEARHAVEYQQRAWDKIRDELYEMIDAGLN